MQIAEQLQAKLGITEGEIQEVTETLHEESSEVAFAFLEDQTQQLSRIDSLEEKVLSRKNDLTEYVLFRAAMKRLKSPKEWFLRDLREQYPGEYERMKSLQDELFKTHKPKPGDVGKIPRVPPNGDLAEAWNRLAAIYDRAFHIYKSVLRARAEEYYPGFERGKEVRRKEQQKWDELKSE